MLFWKMQSVILTVSFSPPFAEFNSSEPPETATRIAHGDSKLRLEPSRTDTELGSLAAAFDRMLDALETAIEEARAKLGDYADALALDQKVRSPRARALGWAPTLHSVSGNVARLLEEYRNRREAA